MRKAPERDLSASEGGVLLSQVHQLSGRVFARILKDRGIDDLNPAQGRIIYALLGKAANGGGAGDGISQTELSERTRLDKSTLTLMLARLEDSGHIERRRDGRVALVYLAAKSLAMIDAYAEASREMIGIYYSGFSEARIRAFEDTLRAIRTNLEGSLSRH